MKHLLLISLAAACVAAQASADAVVATRTIRAQTVLSTEDLAVISDTIPGALVSMTDAIGLETRTTLYAGRPVRPADIGPAAMIERNQIVQLEFISQGLRISAEARALGRAGVGDMVKVMNLSSKSTVSGVVTDRGTVRVGSLNF